MKTFEYHHPQTLKEAVALLPKEEGDDTTRLMAGGQDLIPEMKEHLVEPERVVDLKRIPDLDRLDWKDGALTIGALVTLQDLAEEPEVQKQMTLLAEAAASVGSPQIRSMGTVGGNLNQRPRCWYYRLEGAYCLKKGGTECFSYEGKNKYNAILGGGPSYIVHPSDLAPALVALGATVTLVGPDGERQLPLEKFFTSPSAGNILRETVLAPNEVLTKVHVPAQPAGMRSMYLKYQERDSYDFALSAVAICLWREGGKVTQARLVLGGVAPMPWRVPNAESSLVGQAIDAESIQRCAKEALKGAAPLSENGYKIPLTQGLIRRALETLS